MPIAKSKGKCARLTPLDNQLCEACTSLHQMAVTEKKSGIDPSEKKAVKVAAKEWAQKHLPVVSDHGGQPAQRLILRNNSTGLDFVLNKKFFGETFSKCVRADNTAETMQLATRIAEWLPDAEEVGIKPGRDHECSFKVMKVLFEGRTIQFKAKIIGSELIRHTMRVYKLKNNQVPPGRPKPLSDAFLIVVLQSCKYFLKYKSLSNQSVRSHCEYPSGEGKKKPPAC